MHVSPEASDLGFLPQQWNILGPTKLIKTGVSPSSIFLTQPSGGAGNWKHLVVLKIWEETLTQFTFLGFFLGFFFFFFT